MGLKLLTQRDGTLRKDWYGVYTVRKGKRGVRKVINLNVPWAGNPPESGSLRDNGDPAFERSRERAEAALAAYQDEARRKGRAEHLTERLIESKTGRSVEYARIEDLATRWRSLGREDGPPSEAYLLGCDAKFERFRAFMAERNPAATYLYEVTADDVSAFSAACRSELAPATAKDCWGLLKKAFTHFLPTGAVNPFQSVIKRSKAGETGVVHRRPFKPRELAALLNAAREDGFMHPLVVCAACTGMRRGDVCNLKWSAVDLARGMLAVKTHKNDKLVQIPIFPPLRAVLEAARRTTKGKGLVWPAAVAMLRDNPDGLTWRFKRLVARALGGVVNDAPAMPAAPAAEIVSKGAAAILANIEDGGRRERMMDELRRYCAGQGIRTIEKDLGVARTNVSNDLHAVEKWTGLKIMRGLKAGPGIKSVVKSLTRVERATGKRAASLLDWHALRATWITIALNAGVKMELVRRVTGHATTAVVLEHYYHPDQEDFREALAGALPAVLTGKPAPKSKRLTAVDELAELAEKVRAGEATEADWKRLRLVAAKV